jgi:hypothetical protein
VEFDVNAPPPLEIARDYCDRGWCVVPVPFREKRPIIAEWEKLRLKPIDLPDHFNGKPMNVGVHLGEPSGGLVDVDLDCREAITLARLLLPPTGSIFGRRGNPGSHWLYVAPGVPQTCQYSDVADHPDGQRLIELRSKGGQTVFPGSTHKETGESIVWECDQEPAIVDADELQYAVRKVAAGSLIARHWPVRGSRHTTALALSAVLVKAGWAVETIEEFVRAVACAAGDPEVDDRVRTVRDTVKTLEADRKATGWPTLIGGIGDKAAAKLAEWLRITVRREQAEPRDDPLPAPQTIRQLMSDHPQLRPPVIEGLLRRGETMNVIASPKVGKPWLVTDLAIAQATGRPWLGQFKTVPGDVLILDNELHGETSAHRIPKVAAARGVPIDDFADTLHVVNLRGRLIDIIALGSYFAGLEPGKYKLIILDAFYRFMPPGQDENDNATMANVYNHLDQYADRLGCCFVLIHHSSKGSQSDKAVTDVGAGAGSQSRATDAHLILRPHEEDGVVVLDAAVRSFPPVQPLCLRWEFPAWTPEPELDPTQLRKAGRRKRKDDEEPKPAKVEWTIEAFVSRFITAKPTSKDEILIGAKLEKISGRQVESFLTAATSKGLAYLWTIRPSRKHHYATTEQPLTATVREAH